MPSLNLRSFLLSAVISYSTDGRYFEQRRVVELGAADDAAQPFDVHRRGARRAQPRELLQDC
eukprot:274128-Prymnesium_polylepis.1